MLLKPAPSEVWRERLINTQTDHQARDNPGSQADDGVAAEILPPDAAPTGPGNMPANTRSRTCIVTRESGEPARMIRFVGAPDGGVLADLGAKLPGRGAWVVARLAAVETAARKGLFARALKRAARIDAEPGAFAQDVGALLERRVLAGFGLARRAGDAVIGFEKTHALVKAGKAALVVSADDAAADGAGKLGRLAGHMAVPVGRIFSTDILSAALGFDGARHLAIAQGPLGARLLNDLYRLDGFRPVFADAPDAK